MSAGMFIRFCRRCGRCWAIAEKNECPTCGESGDICDAFALIEELAGATVRLDEEAESDQGMREIERA